MSRNEYIELIDSIKVIDGKIVELTKDKQSLIARLQDICKHPEELLYEDILIANFHDVKEVPTIVNTCYICQKYKVLARYDVDGHDERFGKYGYEVKDKPKTSHLDVEHEAVEEGECE